MRLRPSILFAASVAVAALVYVAVFTGNEPRPVRLDFKAYANGEPIVFNQFRYRNPGGDGVFKITDFRFFISNIRLEGDGKVHAVPDSYHLARFDNPEALYSIDLGIVPLDRIEKVHLSIGIDETANSSIESVGDLDPNSRMAWNWEVGYKFVLLEGTIQMAGAAKPLVYHVGFSENRRDLVFELKGLSSVEEYAHIAFDVDILQMFEGEETIDLSTKPSVLFDKSDAQLVANNYAKLISLVD